jgi:serine/threonine-protein kinase
MAMPQPGATLSLAHLELTLHERIGQSAYGVVWRATHAHDACPVAVKLLNVEAMGLAPPMQQQRWRTGFQTEIAFLGNLTPWEQRAIVRMHGHGQADGQPAFAMELLAGDLAAWMKARAGQAVNASSAFAWLAQINQALETVHRAGCRYLDLKPSNLLLTGDGRLKLADFGTVQTGLAGAAEDYAGTAMWQAPEQFQAGPDARYHSDWRSDYFAMGAILYWLVTGSCLAYGRQCASARHAVLTAGATPAITPHAERAPVLLPSERQIFTDRLLTDGWDSLAAKRGSALLSQLLAENRVERPASALDIGRALRGLKNPACALAMPPVREAA